MNEVGQLAAVVHRLAGLADRLGQRRGAAAEDANFAHLRDKVVVVMISNGQTIALSCHLVIKSQSSSHLCHLHRSAGSAQT